MSTKTPADLLQEAATAVQESRFNDALQAYTELLSLTNARTDDPMIKEARLVSLAERGRLLRALGDQATALTVYQQYRNEAHTDHHRIEALSSMGRVQQDMGQTAAALHSYDEGIELAQASHYLLGLAKAMSGKGYLLFIAGRNAEAMPILNEANRLFEKSGSLQGQLDTSTYMGIAYSYDGELDKAAQYFLQALKFARRLEATDRIIVCLNNVGEVYQMLFDMERAYQYHLEALELIEKAQMRRIESDLYRNLGLELHYLGQKEQGIAYLEQALQLSETNNNSSVIFPTLYALSLAELDRDHLAMAKTYAERLYEQTKRDNNPLFLAQALDALARCEQKAGNKIKAEELWQEATFLAHDTHQRILLWQIHGNLAEIAANRELSNVHRRIAREIIEQIIQPIQDEALRQRYLSAPSVQAVLRAVS